MPTSSVGKSFTVAKISRIEKVWLRGGEYQVFTSKNFCLTVPKIFRGRIPHCCNNFGYRKSLDRRGEYQGFPSRFFCFIVAKNFVGELLCAVFQSFSGSEKDFE